MSFRLPSVLSFGAVFLLSLSAYGNLVVSNPNGVGNWYGPNTATATSGAAGTGGFWDQRSKDGTSCNVGYWLQETTAWTNGSGVGQRCGNDDFASTNGPGALAFYGGATKNDAVGWSFESSGNNVVQLKLEVAGNRGTNVFGWVDSSNVKHQLFAGGDAPSAATVTIPAAAGTDFSFYICPTSACTTTFYSNTLVYGGNDINAGKFALFSEIPQNPGPDSQIDTYWIGVEDTAGIDSTEGRGDYNDFLIRATVVPEPGFYGLLSLGLGVLVYARQRRRVA